MMKKYICAGLAVMLLGCAAACGSANKTDSHKDNASGGAEKKPFLFQSAEDVEKLSQEDLIYIVQNGYQSSDFLEYDENCKIDLYDIPLAVWKLDGQEQTEGIEIRILRANYPLAEMDINERIPEEEFMEYTKDYCEEMIEAQERWREDSDTGTKVKEREIIYCGKDENYAEYSVRFTEARTYYRNNRRVTKDIPRAYRILFDRNRVNVEEKNGVYLGEYTLEKMKAESDFALANGSEPVFYREFSETEEELIYLYYTTGYTCGDYGVPDVAKLLKVTQIYDKKTHETTNREETIVKAEVPGTMQDG